MDFKSFLNFSEMDKKLLIKVVAGILLLATAFVFYIIRDNTDQQDKELLVETGARIESSGAAISDETEIEIVIMVDVAGAVASPGVVSLPEGSRVFQAVDQAGGFSKDAELQVINQAEILSDGQKLYIPTKKEVAESQNSTSDNTNNSSPASHAGSAAPVPAYQPQTYSNGTNPGQSKININTADSTALQQLSGVGPATAEKIISYRNENGRFKTIDEIKNVSGIGDKTFEKFKEKITV